MSGQEDNWVFDSLVNFLHGSIWKVPVVGFIEEKSVVFDPDSYNNMTEEKEAEFRKIHEEYKAVVDFMLSSFMEDLQVTPEQVEEACQVREHQSKSLPESHITKVALEQLWAAEDFTSFRRLMTRKNIDLQLQSLELLVAKYGVLSPALRSGGDEPTGEDGEDDFLQVVIRYSDQLEMFKCDYGEGSGGSETKNMKVHLSGVQFQDNIAPTPVNYQATLLSSAGEIEDKPLSPEPDESLDAVVIEDEPRSANLSFERNSCSPQITEELEHIASARTPSATCTPDLEEDPVLSEACEVLPEQASESNEPGLDEVGEQPNTPPPSVEGTVENIDEVTILAPPPEETEVTENEAVEVAEVEEKAESQLIQLEEAEAAMEEESKVAEGEDIPPVVEEPEPVEDVETTPTEESKDIPTKMNLTLSPRLDEKTVAEIASSAPEQRRVLTAVRKALELNPDEVDPQTSIDIPSSLENDEDLDKRREYLRAQRDRLIAMKKQEREKLLLENSSSGHQPARPKSARAAQMAIRNPLNMRAASIGSEKSLSARRALADRLKQELIDNK